MAADRPLLFFQQPGLLRFLMREAVNGLVGKISPIRHIKFQLDSLRFFSPGRILGCCKNVPRCHYELPVANPDLRESLSGQVNQFVVSQFERSIDDPGATLLIRQIAFQANRTKSRCNSASIPGGLFAPHARIVAAARRALRGDKSYSQDCSTDKLIL